MLQFSLLVFFVAAIGFTVLDVVTSYIGAHTILTAAEPPVRMVISGLFAVFAVGANASSYPVIDELKKNEHNNLTVMAMTGVMITAVIYDVGSSFYGFYVMCGCDKEGASPWAVGFSFVLAILSCLGAFTATILWQAVQRFGAFEFFVDQLRTEEDRQMLKKAR